MPEIAYPQVREHPLHPPKAYARLTAEHPVFRVDYRGTPTWVITGYADARAALSDPRFSGDSTRPGFPMLGPAAAAPEVRTFTRMDPPRHDILRRMLTADFSIKKVNGMRALIARKTDDLIDALLEQHRPADFVEHVALPLPSLVISEMLGVPYRDHAFFEQASRRAVSQDPDEVRLGMGELMPYLRGLVDEADRDPGDDLLGRLVRRSREDDDLDLDQITRMARQVLTAGHETTANNLGLAVLEMLLDEDFKRRALESEASLARATEELLRFNTTVQVGVPRVVTEDLELGGEQLRAGDGVIVSLSAANRDAAAFAGDPDVIDAARDARHHVGFGFGIHQCLGQNLARVELQEGLRVIFERLPGLRLAVPAEELTFKSDRIVYGLEALPVTW